MRLPGLCPKEIFMDPKNLTSEQIELLGLFAYAHLPEPMQEFSKPLGDLAYDMAEKLGATNMVAIDFVTRTGGFQLTDGLKHLLLAKDCFVRASKKLPPDQS
jgi:hypothetical protein